MRNRGLIAVLLSGIMLSACASPPAQPDQPDTTASSVGETSPSSTAPDATTDPEETTTSTTGNGTNTTLAPTSDRPVAPDFTLALGDGGEYTLSESGNPVYLVFWAEW